MRKLLLITCLLFSQAAPCFEYDGAYMAPSLKRQLDTWNTQQRSVNGVYLFGNEWIANAGSDVACSGGAISDLCDRFRALASAGDVILDYAEDAKGRSIIVTRDSADYSDGNHFSAIGIVAAINRLRGPGSRVNSVALFENDGWLVIAQGQTEGRDLPYKLEKALEEAKWGDHHLTRVFSRFRTPTESEWVLLASGDFWTNRPNSKLQATLVGFTRNQRYLGPVFFDNTRYVAVSNHARVLSSSFDRLEYDLRASGEAHALLERMAHHHVPGVSISIVVGDEILTRTYGVLNHATQRKATSSSYFPAASLSKAVFSYGMLKAHESQVLDLDQTLAEFALRYPGGLVRTWYDSLPNTAEKPYQDRTAEITLRALLSHTGGTSVHGIGGYTKGTMRSLSDLIMGRKGRTKVEPIDEPNTHFRYSGGGYSLVEAALQDATGVPAGDWLGLNVLRPLKMENSTFNYLHSTREADFARGHNASLNPFPLSYCPGKGAGGLTTNSRDYAHFLWSVMNAAKIQGEIHPYISRGSHREIFKPASSLTSSGDRCGPGLRCATAGEFCVFNQCREPLPHHDGGTGVHYGPGQNHSWQRADVVELGSTFRYPRESEHGGVQGGIRPRFFYDYSRRMGMVVMTNGERTWADEDKVTRGADLLIDEIKAAFSRQFGY